MTPGVVEAKFPTLLDFPAPRLRTYPRETPKREAGDRRECLDHVIAVNE